MYSTGTTFELHVFKRKVEEVSRGPGKGALTEPAGASRGVESF